MFEVLRESFSMHNLPVSALLGMVLLYWLLVIVGILDNDMDGDGDFRLGDGDGGHAHGLGGASAGGAWSSYGRFLRFGEVPLSVLGSFLAVFMWVISVLLNFYFNGTPGNRSSMLAFIYLFPNLFVSLILTRIATIPLQRIFNAMHHSATEAETVLGREGCIVSVQVDERYGQAEISTNSVPVLLNVRLEPGREPLPKGARVLFLSESPDQNFYFVRAVNLETSTLPS